MQTIPRSRIAGGLILLATVAAVFLMLHHPTSMTGTEDGRFLADWSSAPVHGAMIAGLFVLMLGFSFLPDFLGRGRVSVRAGQIAFTAGMVALAGAALVNGFALGTVVAAAPGSGDLTDQVLVLGALNRALDNLGLVLVAAAMVAWAVRMIRLDLVFRVIGALGILAALLAVGWLHVGQGAFGLEVAVVATLVFAVWSSLIGLRMMRAPAAD